MFNLLKRKHQSEDTPIGVRELVEEVGPLYGYVHAARPLPESMFTDLDPTEVEREAARMQRLLGDEVFWLGGTAVSIKTADII